MYIQLCEEYIENRNLFAWPFVDYKNPMRRADIRIKLNGKT